MYATPYQGITQHTQHTLLHHLRRQIAEIYAAKKKHNRKNQHMVLVGHRCCLDKGRYWSTATRSYRTALGEREGSTTPTAEPSVVLAAIAKVVAGYAFGRYQMIHRLAQYQGCSWHISLEDPIIPVAVLPILCWRLVFSPLHSQADFNARIPCEWSVHRHIIPPPSLTRTTPL